MEGGACLGRGQAAGVVFCVQEGGQGAQVCVAGADRSECCGGRFHDAAHVEHFQQGGAAADLGEDGEGFEQSAGVEFGDVDACAVPRFQYPQGGQDPDRFPHGAAGESHFRGEFPLGGEPLAGVECSVGDHRLDLFDCSAGHRHPSDTGGRAHGALGGHVGAFLVLPDQ